MKKNIISFGKIGLKPMQQSATEKSEGFGTFGKNLDSKKISTGSEGTTNINSKDEVTNSIKQEDIQDTLGFTSFGKKAKAFDIEALAEQSRRIGVERNKLQIEKLTLQSNEENEDTPSEHIKIKSENEKSSSEDEEEFVGPEIPTEILEILQEEYEDEQDGYGLPITHELSLKHGKKAVTAIAVDPAGSRVATGSLDYDVKFWDFQGMDALREPFRKVRPFDGYPIKNTEYSATGDKVLVISGSVQGKVYDRDGMEVYECVRGDMYLHDMAKTKGHIAGLTDGKWHPKDKDEFLTSARDGTCRIWKIQNEFSQLHVIKPRSIGGLKALPTTCNYSNDGNIVACACIDGSIQMWDHRKNYVNTITNIKKAHQPNTETSCLTFSYDGKSFATRGEDCLKLWDIRNSKNAVSEVYNLYSRFPNTDCIFSPDDKYVLTCTSLEKEQKSNTVKLYNRSTLELVKELDIGQRHGIRLKWHPRLNQIMIGCGDGDIVIFYDQQKSHNGAILVSGKRKVRAKQPESISQILVPHALPMFREDRYKPIQKREEKDRQDPVRSRQPELPLGKTGSGGRVASGGSTLSSYIIRNMGLRNKSKEEEDPREALLRHAKEAEENPYWVAPAYTSTQPKPIFDDSEPAAKKQKTEESNAEE